MTVELETSVDHSRSDPPDRLSPREAWEASERGALIVDIRAGINRELEGSIPGAVVIDPDLLGYRLDPASDARIQQASHDLAVILVCNEGSSSRAIIATLPEMGLRSITDVRGGFRAWRTSGLPVEPSAEVSPPGSGRKPMRRAPSRPRRGRST